MTLSILILLNRYITIPKPENVLLIDSRPKEAKFDKGHIPTAINIPDTSFEKMTDLLPQDKNTLLIFYCEGLECKLSHKSAKKAEALGYTQVKVYAEGYPGWMKDKENYAEVPVDFVKTAMDNKTEMVLVDSRPREGKYDQGHIPTAINIPDTHFEKMTNLLPEKKDTLLVFYCGGFDCKLSHKSASKAIKMGYTQCKCFFRRLSGMAGNGGKIRKTLNRCSGIAGQERRAGRGHRNRCL